MIKCAVVAALFAIVVKLGDLQLMNEVVYGKKSEEITTRILVQQPLRGEIFDRNGSVLVENDPAYEVSVIPYEFKNTQIPSLAALLQMDSIDISRRIQIGENISPYFPVRLKRDIPFATLSSIEEHLKDFVGVYFDIEPKRVYIGKARAAHVLGFTKEISEPQLATLGDYYKPGDIVGYTGLEASYETILRGQKGLRYLAVNARGQTMGSYDNGKIDVQAQDGSDLHLSLDEGLQVLAESLMVGKKGAVVALDPNNGEVLAMVSAPDFDPSVFSGYTSKQQWEELNNGDNHALFNRATMSVLPPGSTFKMVLASAALQEGTIKDSWTVHCPGSFYFGTRLFRDDAVHGTVNVYEAIEKSCDVYFYNLMLKVGFDAWTKYGEMFGFGTKTGIDLREESAGILPSRDYYDQIFGKNRWTSGYLISLAIGQGEVSVTPLQLAAYTMTLANFGDYFQPHIVRYICDQRTGKTFYTQYSERNIPISKEVFDELRQGMELVVNGPAGTGSVAQIPGVIVAGKTGTAQNPHGKPHSWFIAFAPFDNPKIALCVLVENAGWGGSVAAPIAKQLLQYYLNETGALPQPQQNRVVAAAVLH
ncbi:MAG TPA: penicillin-binding protein 2 [Candidatus Acidoferrales bacterium]|nr:penicillin-binding protein 2 [Candidatus Acidoferrales bacterium]